MHGPGLLQDLKFRLQTCVYRSQSLCCLTVGKGGPLIILRTGGLHSTASLWPSDSPALLMTICFEALRSNNAKSVPPHSYCTLRNKPFSATQFHLERVQNIRQPHLLLDFQPLLVWAEHILQNEPHNDSVLIQYDTRFTISWGCLSSTHLMQTCPASSAQ